MPMTIERRGERVTEQFVVPVSEKEREVQPSFYEEQSYVIVKDNEQRMQSNQKQHTKQRSERRRNE